MRISFAVVLTTGLLGALASQGMTLETNYKVGESSGKLLEFPASVRAVGMGGAFTGLADDVTGLFWNPAGLANVSDRELTLGYTNLYSLMNVESVVYGQPLAGGVGGIAVQYADYGSVDRFGLDEHENPFSLNSTLSPHAIFGNLAWSQSVTKYFSLGMAVKAIQEDYGVENHMVVALDLGAYYMTGIRDLNVGFCAQNLQIPFVRSGLPILIRTGLSYRLPALFREDHFTGVVDFVLPTVSLLSSSVGCEYWFRETVGLRAGYRFNERNQDDSLLGFSVGASLKAYFFQIDYAFLPNSEIGDVHRISLTARFSSDLENGGTPGDTSKKPGTKRYLYQFLFSTE